MNKTPASLSHEKRSKARFRKPCRSRFPSHTPVAQCHSRTARTCFEGPFGEVIRRTGDLAKADPFRFSTKYQDEETDLLYYGYRYYDASQGRWVSRDPIEEKGGVCVYALLSNDAIGRIDHLGLKPKSQCQLASSGIVLSFVFDGLAFSGNGVSLPAVSGAPVKVAVTRRWQDVYQYSTWYWHSEDVTFDYSVARQKLKNIGPIPEGSYYIENCEERCAATSPYSHVIKKPAWGDYSWSLHPESGTQTYGRGGFFIHGGNRWGSAGCIDLESGDATLHELFKGIGNTGCCFIPVTVRYSVQEVTKSDTILDSIITPPVGY